MLGLYDRTPLRRKVDLDGWWDFVTDEDEQGERARFFDEFPLEDSRRTTVPGVWETQAGFEDYRGVAWYHREFEAPWAGACLLTFGAVAYRAKVWLNGEYLGEHEGSFTAFRFIGNLSLDVNDLVVRVDNRHSDETLPKETADWYHYGGISRSVVCEEIDDAYIEQVHVVGRLDGQVDVRATIVNGSDREQDLELALSVPDAEATARTVTLGPGVRVVEELRVRIDEPQWWSPADPVLYEAIVTLGEDMFVERFGLREVRTDGPQILLNGEPIWLRGVNRHEDHPDWGFALPERIMLKDIDIILSLNCNAVRGSHYPNHPTFLDLCDENGLLFVAEIPGWQYSAYQLSHSPTKDLLGSMLQEMVAQQYNHPSIIIWSLHNESETDVSREPDLDVRTATEELFALARSLDDTRLITYVSHRYWRDKHFDLADVVCLNEYIGWYVDDIDGADFPAYLERMAEMVPDKPILITEFGAGGIPGYHSMAARKWSEERQSTHIITQIEAMRSSANVAGCFVWQYCDVGQPQGVLLPHAGHEQQGAGGRVSPAEAGLSRRGRDVRHPRRRGRLGAE